MGRLLDDPARRARLAAAAAAAVREYDWQVVARDVLRVYEAVAPGRPAGARGGAVTIITSFIVIALLAMTGVYVSWRAGRLDRLHARLEAARFALDAALVRRSSVALELASSGLLDPATSVLLAGAAHDARAARSRPASCPRAT